MATNSIWLPGTSGRCDEECGVKACFSGRSKGGATGRAHGWACLLGGALSITAPALQAAGAASCLVLPAAPLLIASADSPGGVAIDPACHSLYWTDSTANVVNVVNIATGALTATIPVGSKPAGLDFSPDGSILYVANSSGNSISVVDPVKGVETSRINVTPGFMNNSPLSVAVSASGKVFFSTTFAGSGFGGQMMEYDPATAQLRQRTDFYANGATTEATQLAASSDRTTIGIVAGDISSGPVFVYNSATDTFSPEHDTNSFISYVGLDASGANLLVDPNAYIFNGSLVPDGTLANLGLGVAVDPAGAVGYQVNGGNINVLDLKHAVVTKTLPLGDTTGNGAFYDNVGRMTRSADGALLAVITDHGVALLASGIVRSVAFSSFVGAVRLGLDVDASGSRFDLATAFTLGAASQGLSPANSVLQLAIGNLAINLPAGSLQAEPDGYAFKGTASGGTLHLNLERLGSTTYRLLAEGSGYDFSGSTLPVAVALSIGSDAGRMQLVRGDAELHTPGSDPVQPSTASTNSAAPQPHSAIPRDLFDRRGNLVTSAADPLSACAYGPGSIGRRPSDNQARCLGH